MYLLTQNDYKITLIFIALSIQQIFYQNNGGSGPQVTGTLSATPNVLYDVVVELYGNDLGSSSEYAVIMLNQEDFGDCGPTCEHCCACKSTSSCTSTTPVWYNCATDTNRKLSKSEIRAPSDGVISIEVQYMPAVDSFGTCRVPGTTDTYSYSISRFTLTPK